MISAAIANLALRASMKSSNLLKTAIRNPSC
jgi:hypothetical protein